MKKYLFLASVAALSFTACTNETEEYVGTGSANQQKEIAFFAVNQKATKGAITDETFPTSLNMKVTSFDVTNGHFFFDATTFKYNWAGGESGASHGYWGGDPARYWPLSAAYFNFLAIANANADDETDVTWGTYKANQVEIEMADNYAYTVQRDLVYAIGNAEVTQTGNALSFPDKVDMTFNHAQAYLVFRVKAADNASKAIKIKNIKVKGAYTKGTATITQTNYNAQSGQATTLYWTDKDYHTSASTYESVTDNQSDLDPLYQLNTGDFVQKGQLMVVPNMSAVDTYAEGGFTSFEVIYTLQDNEYTFEYTPVTTKLEAGKKYIYDITFKLHEIYINPSVETWDAAPTHYVDIPATSMAKESLTAVTLDNAAGVYSFMVTGFTAGQTVSVAETTDANNIITSVAAPSTVPTGGAVTVEVTKPETTNDKSATITLTVNSTPYVITIKTPVTPAP